MDAKDVLDDKTAKEEKDKPKEALYTTFLDNDNLPQFKCVQCGVTYIKRCMMEKHVVVHSSQREKFKCDECGQSFNRKATVREHKQRTHKKIERFSCFVCKKGFYERSCMLKHLNVHDDAIERNPGKPLGFLPEKLLNKLVAKGTVKVGGRQVSSSTVCLQCRKILSTAQTLKRHRCPSLKVEESIKTEEPIKSEKSIGCILDCSKVFEDLASFDLHMAVGDHDGLFFFSCSGCDKKFASTKSMKGHICQKHTEEETVATEIGFNYSPTAGNLIVENPTVIGNKAEDFNEGGDSAALDISKRYEIVAKDEEVGGELVEEYIELEGDPVLETTANDFEQERNDKERKGCPVSDTTTIDHKAANPPLTTGTSDFDQNYQRNELSELKSLSCNECGHNFSSAPNLEFHLRIHRIEKIQLCRSVGCGLTFTNRDLLVEHKLAVHGIQSQNNGSRYVKEKCEQCELKFTRYDMKKHMLRHNGEKNFTCAECGKKLKRLESLKLHMMLHSGEKNNNCDQCGHSFFTIQSLQNHRNNKHNSDNINMCAECGKECPNKYDLKWHMAKHTGEKSFACREDGCGKRFRISHMRSNHEKIHSGQRDFHCTQCDKKFIQRTSLMTHLKRHNGIKDHKCVTCGKAFVEPAGARLCKHGGISTRRSTGVKWESS